MRSLSWFFGDAFVAELDQRCPGLVKGFRERRRADAHRAHDSDFGMAFFWPPLYDIGNIHKVLVS
jgi:hypothetical protein